MSARPSSSRWGCGIAAGTTMRSSMIRRSRSRPAIGMKRMMAPNEWPGPFWALLGNGGIVWNIPDMLKWHKAVHGDLLPAKYREQLFEPVVPDTEKLFIRAKPGRASMPWRGGAGRRPAGTRGSVTLGLRSPPCRLSLLPGPRPDHLRRQQQAGSRLSRQRDLLCPACGRSPELGLDGRLPEKVSFLAAH